MKKFSRFLCSLLADLLYILVFPFIYFKIKKAGYIISVRWPFKTGCIAFRCASVGEVSLIAPLVEALGSNYEVLILVNTLSGYTKAKLLYKDAGVAYAPLDFSFVVRRFYKYLQPKLVVLVEQELWPNFIWMSRSPIVLVNARMTESTARFYRWFETYARSIFSRMAYISAANSFTHQSLRRFASEKVELTGNLKIDAIRVVQYTEKKSDQLVITLANSHHPEEKIVLEIIESIKRQFRNIRLIIAPRHIDRISEIEGLMKERNVSFARYGADSEVVLVDKIGIMSEIYSLSHLVIMGGSFVNKGGHNFLEAAAYGCAICQGPYFHNFYDETIYFEGKNAIVLLHTFKELEVKLQAFISDRALLKTMGDSAREALISLKGSSEKIKRNLDKVLLEASR